MAELLKDSTLVRSVFYLAREVKIDAYYIRHTARRRTMKTYQRLLFQILVLLALTAGPALASDSLKGQVLGAGAPIAKSTVTLWAAGFGAPRQLAQTQTSGDGQFKMTVQRPTGDGSVLYLVARGGQPAASKVSGDNKAIVLMAVLGSRPRAKVVLNELTTVASVWTGAQFLNGTAFSGKALGLRIAAGNVPNLVDLETGGLGPVIQDPLNSSQTATLATFNTLANLLTGCITRVHVDACNNFFAAATPPGGTAPTDTLTAAQNIARNPSHQAKSLFALLDEFYPVPAGKRWRPVRGPFRWSMPAAG
jgi:hypothetical protein